MRVKSPLFIGLDDVGLSPPLCLRGLWAIAEQGQLQRIPADHTRKEKSNLNPQFQYTLNSLAQS